MNEKILRIIALIFRKSPHFRGKYRIGKFIQKLFIKKNNWQNPEFFIQLKNKSELFIDIRSKTHSIPFWTGMRDDEIINQIIKNLTPNSIVLDVGANIGYYTIPIAKKISTLNGSVHAFEPVKENFFSLRKAVERNRVEKNVVLNQFALGDYNGSIEIVKTEQGKSSNAVLSFNDEQYEKGLSKETIEIKMLDDYMNQINRCDFIKVDIEGAEYFLIKGGTKFIEKFKPVIYGEFNAFFLRKFGFTLLDIWKILAPIGYEAYVEDRIKKGKFIKTEVKENLIDVLFLPAEEKATKKWITH
ncbi:MAG: FkbM family methyltransferase [Flavobacteriales bacterium]|nr:FkbM family methyltransferase [Flavobacteriales bacterium]